MMHIALFYSLNCVLSLPLVFSLSILEPIVSQEVHELPIWESWVQHRQLLMFVTRTSFEVHEVEELGNLVHDYLAAFNKVQAHMT